MAIRIKPFGAGEMTASRLTVSGEVMTVWFAGGVPGRLYTVNIEAQTTAGRNYQWEVELMCDPRFALGRLPFAANRGFGPALTWGTGSGGSGGPSSFLSLHEFASGTETYGVAVTTAGGRLASFATCAAAASASSVRPAARNRTCSAFQLAGSAGFRFTARR